MRNKLQEEDALEEHPTIEIVGKEHFEVERDIHEEHPATLIATIIFPNLSHLKVGLGLSASVILGSSSSSPHYARVKSAKASQILMGPPALDQLSCVLPFSGRLHSLSTNMKIFYNKVLFTEGNTFEVCTKI